MLFFIGVGLISFWGGSIAWFCYTFFLKIPVPFPSYADVFFSLLYPFFIIGTIFFIKVYQTLITKSVLKDAAIITVVSFVAIIGYLGLPDVSEDLSFAQKFINVYYPIGDAVITAIALIAIRIGGRRMHTSFYSFAFGLIVFSAADIIFSSRTSAEIYWNGDISDFLYSVGALFISFGIFEIINNLSQTSEPPNAPSIPVSSAVAPENI
jgi:diguanylate cyclase